MRRIEVIYERIWVGVAATLVSFLLLAFVDWSFRHTGLLAATLWLAMLFPDFFILTFSLAGLLALAVGGNSTGVLSLQIQLFDVPAHWLFLYGPAGGWAEWQFTLLRVACILAWVLSLYFALALSSRFAKYAISISLLILFSLVVGFDSLKEKNAIAACVVLTSLFLWTKIVWGFLLILKTGAWSGKPRLAQMWMLFPPWSFDSIPSWKPVRVDALGAEARRRAGISIRNVIAFSLSLLLLLWLDQWLAFKMYRPAPEGWGLPDIRGSGTIIFLERVPNMAIAWGLITWSFLRFLFVGLGLILSLPYLVLTILGIPAFTSVSSPYLATSFHEFSSRILRFYVQLITAVFYPPMVKLFGSVLEYGRLRVLLCTFCGVTALGALYHFANFLPLLTLMGGGEAVKIFFLDQWMYLGAFSLFTAFSVAWGFRRKPRRGTAFHVLRLAGIVAAYSVILALNPVGDSWEWRLRLLKFLFTGQK